MIFIKFSHVLISHFHLLCFGKLIIAIVVTEGLDRIHAQLWRLLSSEIEKWEKICNQEEKQLSNIGTDPPLCTDFKLHGESGCAPGKKERKIHSCKMHRKSRNAGTTLLWHYIFTVERFWLHLEFWVFKSCIQEQNAYHTFWRLRD